MPTLFLVAAAALLTAPPGDSAFVVNGASTEPTLGPIVRIDADGTISLGGDRAVAVTGADVIALTRRGMPLPPPPSGSHLVFANGDRMAGEVLAIADGKVRFKAMIGREPTGEGVQVVDIPLSALAVLWFQAPPADIGEELARQWAAERRRRDVVRLRNGDERAGTVKALKEPSAPLVLTQDGGRDAPLDSGLIVAVAMNTDLARTLKPRGAYWRIVLANGSRLSALSIVADETTLTAKPLFGGEVRIPLDQVVALDRRQGRGVYLSDLKPARYDHEPYLGVRWPYELDRSVAGNDQRLGGSTYDKGVGMHSASRLTFDLNGQYRRFEAIVGLNDRTGRGGRVVARVLIDGKPRDLGFQEVSFVGGPKPVRLEVTDARELTLVVEYGAGGDVCDHVDWAEARLVK